MLRPLLGPGIEALLEWVTAQNIHDGVWRYLDLHFGHLSEGLNVFGGSHNVFRVGILSKVEHLFPRWAYCILRGWCNMIADWEIFGGCKGLSMPHGTLRLTLRKKVALGQIGLWSSCRFDFTKSKSGATSVLFESFNSCKFFIVLNSFIFKFRIYFLIFAVE